MPSSPRPFDRGHTPNLSDGGLSSPPPAIFVSSAPASRKPSRAASPGPARHATSCPASPRASARSIPQRALLVPARSPTRAIRGQPYHAIFGSDPRVTDSRSTWPVQTPEPLGVARTPEMCRVHAFAGMRSTLKSTGAATFGNHGKAVRGVRPPPAMPSCSPPIHSYASYTSFGKAGGATFGTPHFTPRRMAPGHLASRSGLMSTVAAPREAPRRLHRLPQLPSNGSTRYG